MQTLAETKGKNLEYAEKEFAAIEKRDATNKNFVKAFKKASGVKKQTTLPTASVLHNEWAVKHDWSMADAMTWRCLCEKVKYAQEDAESSALFAVIADTIDLSAHCETHPVGLIHFARTSFGLRTWDMDAIEFLKDNLLAEDDKAPSDHDDDDTDVDKELGGVCPPAPQKKRKAFGLAESLEE